MNRYYDEIYNIVYSFFKNKCTPAFIKIMKKESESFDSIAEGIVSLSLENVLFEDFIKSNADDYVCTCYLIPDISTRYDIYVTQKSVIMTIQKRNEKDQSLSFDKITYDIAHIWDLIKTYTKDYELNAIQVYIEGLLDSNDTETINNFLKEVLKKSYKSFYYLGYKYPKINTVNELGELITTYRTDTQKYMIYKKDNLINIIYDEKSNIEFYKDGEINRKCYLYTILFDKVIELATFYCAVSNNNAIIKEKENESTTD